MLGQGNDELQDVVPAQGGQHLNEQSEGDAVRRSERQGDKTAVYKAAIPDGIPAHLCHPG